jgi:hypothetical protein
MSYEDVDYAMTFKVNHHIDDPYRNIHPAPTHPKEECHAIVSMLEGIFASLAFEGNTLFANAAEVHFLSPSP